MEEMIRVLFCQRNRHPEEREIRNNKTDFEELVDGRFAEWRMTHDVFIIYNPTPENKLKNLVNRILVRETEPVDYIRGDFFVCGRVPEGYRSLTDYEIEKIDPCIQLTEIELHDVRSALRGDNHS